MSTIAISSKNAFGKTARTYSKLLVISLCPLFSALSSVAAGQCTIKPIVDFTANDGCEEDSVYFMNKSQNASSYLWIFGDGTTSTETSPKHLYPYFGNTRTFTIVLLAYTKDCVDSIVKNVTLFGAKSSFNFTNSEKTFYFSSTSSWVTKYSWKFGDGDSSNAANPTHIYTDTFSKHTVCLEVTNPMNCTNQKCSLIITPNIAGILKHRTIEYFSIFPNPNFGSFTIKLDYINPNQYLEITNSAGKVVHKVDRIPETLTLELPLSKGLYFARIVDYNGILISKTMLIE